MIRFPGHDPHHDPRGLSAAADQPQSLPHHVLLQCLLRQGTKDGEFCIFNELFLTGKHDF